MHFKLIYKKYEASFTSYVEVEHQTILKTINARRMFFIEINIHQDSLP